MILVEVKPTVGATLEVVDGKYLGQLFTQSYYSMVQYGMDSIVCALTDRVTWHFFKLNLIGEVRPPNKAYRRSTAPFPKKQRTSAPVQSPLISIVWAKTERSNAGVVSFVGKCLQVLSKV